MIRKLVEITAVILIFSTLVSLYTWPLPAEIDSQLHGGDPYLITWILSYSSTALFENPAGLFDSPIMYPHKTTLAYSENLLGMQPFYLPALLITRDRVAAYNLLVLFAYILAGLSMYLLCRFGLGFKFLPSVLAGLVFTFSPYRFGHIYHIHVLWTFWMPIAAWLIIRLIKSNKWKSAIGLGFVFLLQALASLYVMAYIGILLVVLFIFLVPQVKLKWNLTLKLVSVAAVCCLVLLPVLLPYMSVRDRLGYERTTDQIIGGGAFIEHLLAPSHFSAGLHQTLFRSLSHSEKNLFIGFACFVLVLLGSVKLIGKSQKSPPRTMQRLLKWIAIGGGIWFVIAIAISYLFPDAIPVIRLIHTYSQLTVIYPLSIVLLLWLKGRSESFKHAVQLSFLTIIVVGVFFSFGPQIMVNAESIGPGPYSLMLNIPLVSAFRATARWFNLALVGISVMAAIGFQFFTDRWQHRPVIKAIAISAILLFTIYEHIPGRSLAAPPLELPDAAYTEWLKKQPDDIAIIELPLRSSIPGGETVYLVRQRDHGRKIVNGYSGFESPAYQYLASVESQINDAKQLSRLRCVSADYCIVHLDFLTPQQQIAWHEVAEKGRPGIRFIKQSGQAMIFKITAGASGDFGRFYLPANTTQIDFTLKGRDLNPERTYFTDIYIDGSHVKSLKLIQNQQDQHLDLQDNHSGGARLAEFYLSYLLDRQNSDSASGLPFLLHLETGGSDPNHCIVGINGRYWPREKGLNIYLLNRDGRVLEYRTFNTSWYESESDLLLDYIMSISGGNRYLIVVSRHFAGRRLTLAGRRAMGRLGLNNISEMKDEGFAMGLVDLSKRLAILDHTSSQRISRKDAAFVSEAMFELTDFKSR